MILAFGIVIGLLALGLFLYVVWPLAAKVVSGLSGGKVTLPAEADALAKMHADLQALITKLPANMQPEALKLQAEIEALGAKAQGQVGQVVESASQLGSNIHDAFAAAGANGPVLAAGAANSLAEIQAKLAPLVTAAQADPVLQAMATDATAALTAAAAAVPKFFSMVSALAVIAPK
jgi:hypothetical protein